MESGLNWGKIGGEKGAEWQFVRDILSNQDFQWVVKGVEPQQVLDKMKQTLGLRKVQGRPEAEMHQILIEAIELKILTRQRLNGIIEKINNGTLVRRQGY